MNRFVHVTVVVRLDIFCMNETVAVQLDPKMVSKM